MRSHLIVVVLIVRRHGTDKSKEPRAERGYAITKVGRCLVLTNSMLVYWRRMTFVPNAVSFAIPVSGQKIMG